MSLSIWQECLAQLNDELSNSDFCTWLQPMQARYSNSILSLYSPNQFVSDWVRNNYMDLIENKVQQITQLKEPNYTIKIRLLVGDPKVSEATIKSKEHTAPLAAREQDCQSKKINTNTPAHKSNLFSHFSFNNFIGGKSNSDTLSATLQTAEKPGEIYNPLFLYAHPGLGKTHLLHAVGNKIVQQNPESKVVYIQSERFAQEMINSIRNKTLEQFKEYYGSLDVILIDDIQYFSDKARYQEVLFQIINSMLEGHQQVILTSYRIPTEIDGFDEYLHTNFVLGLSIPIVLPELDVCVEILITKAEKYGLRLPVEIASFIVDHLAITDIRFLEGAISNISAKIQFTGQDISISLVQDALHDMFVVDSKKTTIDNIKKVVAKHYRIKISDLSSKRKTAIIPLPHQIAMALAKELTQDTLPEIGEAFGGLDHALVLHACRKIATLRNKKSDVEADYKVLIRTLSM